MQLPRTVPTRQTAVPVLDVGAQLLMPTDHPAHAAACDRGGLKSPG